MCFHVCLLRAKTSRMWTFLFQCLDYSHCTHHCLPLMGLEKSLQKQWICHLFNLHSRVCFHSKWTQADTLTLHLIFLCLYVCCGPNEPLSRSSYVSLCLHACCVCVYLCVFSGNVPGMRPAEAGEFTRRAFQAGKMGLTEVVKKGMKKTHNTQQRRFVVDF